MSSSPKISEAFSMNLDKREISEGATIADAVDVMKDIKYNCLLVKDAYGKGIGILSEHDIVSAFADEGDNAKTSYVSDFMTMDIICAHENQTLDEVIKLMAEQNIRHVPILSESGGVLSFVSIMELIMAKMTAI